MRKTASHGRSKPKAGVTTTSTYTYGPEDRRLSKTVGTVTTNYLWAGDDIIAEYGGTGTLLRRYIPGPGIDEPVAMVTYNSSGAKTATAYYHADYAGTVVALSDTDGDLEESYTYSAFGEVGTEGVEGNPFRYTGRQLDPETGLYYYRARYYSAALGRFLQTDPIGYQDSLNLYQYALNDPVNYVDPSGQESCASFLERNPSGRCWEAGNFDLEKDDTNRNAESTGPQMDAVAVRTFSDIAQSKAREIAFRIDIDESGNIKATLLKSEAPLKTQRLLGLRIPLSKLTGASAIGHTHPKGKGFGLEPGPGDLQFSQVIGGPNFIGRRDAVGVLEIVEGQPTFRLLAGNVSGRTARLIQSALNDFQLALRNQ